MSVAHSAQLGGRGTRTATEVSELEVSGPGFNFRRPVKTALHQAILDGRIHQVRLLVEKHQSNVDARDMFGRTPLMLGCLLDNEEYGYRMVRLFMRAGADINMTDNMRRTALHYACMKARIDVIKRLLNEDNVNLMLQDNDGNNALMHAALSGNPVIVERVLDKMLRFGLDIDQKNGLGYTAFLLACKFGHFVSAHLLLTKGGAQPDLRDTERHLLAVDWIKQSAHMRAAYMPSRSQTMLEIPQHAMNFARERSMYTERESRPITDCRHAPVSAPNPLGRSIGSALQLPNIFKGFIVDRKSETLINGRSARDLLLEEIDHVIASRRSVLRRQQRMRSFRSASSSTTTTAHARRPDAPSTAKLRSLPSRSVTAHDARGGGGGSKVVVADLRMLFKLYSDQFENWKIPTSSRETSTHHRVRFDTAESSSAAKDDVITPPVQTVPSREDISINVASLPENSAIAV